MLNLKCELDRKGISTRALARLIGVSEKTAWNKANGQNEFSVSEAITVKHELFPEYEYEYLFSTNGT